MALDYWKTKFLTSIHGRKLGVDHNNFLVGQSGAREPFESLTASATMANHGVTVLSGTTAAFTITAPPAVGVYKEIINASSISTAAMAVVRSTASGACVFLPNTSGSTEGATEGNVKRLNLINVGAAIGLRAISSAQWSVVAVPQSSLYYSLSTSS